MLVGITANFLMLGLYAVTRARSIPLFGPHAWELWPLTGLAILAAALEAGALAFLTWDLRRLASPGPMIVALLKCVGPATAAILTVAVCVNPSEPGDTTVRPASRRGITSGACPYRPALAANPDATASPGATVVYEWWVSGHDPEATHYFHSHGNTRLQASHGLFGAVIVESGGSHHLDPVTGEPLSSGWAAIIQPPRGPAFREFALYYHEVGNERYRHLNRQGSPMVQVAPYTSAYHPGDRAMNYLPAIGYGSTSSSPPASRRTSSAWGDTAGR